MAVMIGTDANASSMPREPSKSERYTREEMILLASIRRRSGRTCRNCRWYSARGKQRGCFPEGKYRKWLGPEEYESGCDAFSDSREK
jgi:hypothetical protein